jgi:EAL domain-containing protein (putative c-di-GMP-specific phosphodiesterase class I)
MLADFQPDLLKLDMTLVRGIEGRGPRQAIVRTIMQACVDLGIDVIGEGVETLEEYRWFENAGVTLFQGYLFGRFQFEGLPALQIHTEKQLSIRKSGAVGQRQPTKVERAMGIEPTRKEVPDLENKQFDAITNAKCDGRVNFRSLWGHVGLNRDTSVGEIPGSNLPVVGL